MDLRADATLTQLLSALEHDQREYLRDEEVAYDESGVALCAEILCGHLTALQQARDRNGGLDCVRSAVLKLNELNARCGGELIETDGRETICAFIIRAGALMGFNAKGEDVTYEWREW